MYNRFPKESSRHTKVRIFQSDDKLGYYSEPNRTLARLVSSLPLLASLDISGTNLAGTGSFDAAALLLEPPNVEEEEEEEGSPADGAKRKKLPSSSSNSSAGGGEPMEEGGGERRRVLSAEAERAAARCDIPGLVSRVDSPLEFLGLYKTTHEACCRRQVRFPLYVEAQYSVLVSLTVLWLGI